MTSASVSRVVPTDRSPQLAQMIEQPKRAGSRTNWEQIPERGQAVQFDEQRPIVDLGFPVPADATINVPTRESFSGHTEYPLEAQREPSSSASEGTRRATRSPDPYSKEVGQVDSMDYLSAAPSSVVGVVSMPGVQNRYADPTSDQSMNTFVPSHETVSHVVPASMAESEAISSRMRLASQVSRELLSGSQQSLGVAPLPIEPPAGWKNVESELRAHLTKCDELLRRNAILSAREEVLMGLRVLYRAIDLRSGEWVSEPAFDQALAAFSEESDFHQSLRNPTRAQSTPRIVAGHATQALKQVDLTGVSPELAAQHYRAYARQQLGNAAQGHPWAADLLYALGKTYERRADSSKEDGFMFHNQAVTCYNAALDVVPNHVDGANQLGYTLMKLDRVDEAQAILSQATQMQPSADTWKNLAELYRRRGQMDQAAIAVQQATSLGMPSEASKVPEVYQVDPQTFIGMSPNQFMNPTIANAAPVAPAKSAPAAPPTKSTSWFSRLVR
jgi:tetratricopeptide (TPR) repeat protein